MTLREQVTQTVFTALDEANEVRSRKDWVTKSIETPLVGEGAKLDSLGTVTLMVSIDESIQSAFGVSIDVSNILGADPDTSPLRTVGALIDYILSQLPSDLS